MKGTQMKLLISIILVTISSFTSSAQQKTPPPPGAARPLNLPKITEKKLGNGLTVILAPLPNVPKVSAILTFRAATTGTDRTSHPGIAQIAAGVANEGTDTRTSKQIKEEIRSIGGSLNLGSDADQTNLTATALSEFSSRMRDILPRKPYPTVEGIKAVLDELSPKLPVAKTAQPRDFMDIRFIDALDRSGFIDRLYK